MKVFQCPNCGETKKIEEIDHYEKDGEETYFYLCIQCGSEFEIVEKA